jgi:hypothetical protein
MTPPRNAHVFARLPTYEDFKKYRSAFVWLHRNGHKQGQDGYLAALQTRLEQRSRYGDLPLPVPVHLIDFTRGQLDSVASTVSERLQQLGAPHIPEDAWASLQRDRAGAQTTRRRVSRPSIAGSSVRQVDARSSPASSSAAPASSASSSSVPSSAMSSSSPVTSSSLSPTSPASAALSPVQRDPARATQQDVVMALTEMRELQLELDTVRTRELQSRASDAATTRPQQALNASQVVVQELEASESQLPNALAVRQQELDASRTRELELVVSQEQLSEALQTAQSALHASQTQLQRLHGEMEATRHATDGTIARLQQELDAARAQLDGAADAFRSQEQEVDELRRQLVDAGRAQQQALAASQARMQELRQELDSSRSAQNDLLQRVSTAEKEIKCQEDSLNASVKVGYISRACQQFITRCPTWTHSTNAARLNLSREDALDMLNALEEFDAACSEPARHAIRLDSSSTALQFKKARIAFGLLLHTDKIAAKAVPHRRQRL